MPQNLASQKCSITFEGTNNYLYHTWLGRGGKGSQSYGVYTTYARVPKLMGSIRKDHCFPTIQASNTTMRAKAFLLYVTSLVYKAYEGP